MRYVIAVLLIVEGLGSGTLLASKLSSFAGYDGLTLAVLAIRGGIGVLEFAGGWLLLHRLPVASAFASAVLAASALLRTIELGAGAAPTNIFPTFRWPIVALYWLYAGTCIVLLRRRARPGS